MLRMFPVAILAGGLATRLHPLTRDVPKSLLKLAGRPFILHQLETLREQHAQRVVLCLGHLGEQVQALIGDGRMAGVEIQYSFDGDDLLGTGGALKQALPLLGDDFFVLYGDALLRYPLAQVQAAYTAARRPALMTVLHNENRWDTSNVCFLNGQLLEYSKRSPRAGMEHIDAGLSVLSSSVFADYGAARVIDLADIFEKLSQRGQLAALEVSERFYEIGSRQGLQETEEFLTRKLS